ncbi:TPA: hypothetical protein ACH1J1_003885 [Klebsiella pneumoniae]|uniref:Uncharacterized protein n=1 Tax=Citrobacter portucalensis TaxID=1639133 RepID=A0A5B0T324_9ENTR|nr:MULTISPECIES: hypothetical protein [Enterobacteriaceae]EDU0502595.1 hypothetical protein [Salmonella enterica subsp. salamae]HDT4367450.1 hypothetical protein [Klebsiella aerogenes]EJM8714632.1 hypothetical protein [Klebsiella pneumoniae]KAA1144511.1 hypothetical protein D3H66_08820 [Citrobacter portucalensis]MBC4131296.1 hypothetical protein [Klebsiella pneumoniae]
MSVENEGVVYVNFKSVSQSSDREKTIFEGYETTTHSTIVTIEEYERKKIIDELVERAESIIW